MVDGWRKGLVLLTATAALADCAAPRPAVPRSAGAAETVGVDAPFTLAMGASARVESPDVTIEFQAVESDSRCPSDVTCVWAGDAVAVVEVVARGGRETLRLHTNLEPKKAGALGVELELAELSPYPVSTGKIEAADYRARLVCRRAGT
jgi:hypothetical protein